MGRYDDLDDQDQQLPAENPFWGNSHLYDEKDFPIKEHPATRKRHRERQFSRDYGWIWDFWESVVQWYKDLWTANMIRGLGLSLYGLCMVGIVVGVGYNFIFPTDQPQRREIPTIYETMKAEQKIEDGPPSAPRMENNKTDENK